MLPGPEELSRRLLGAPPDAVDPFFVWDHRATYRVRIGRDEFVVKADADDHELATEAEGHAHAAAHGIPVPELVAVERGALAMRFVAGEQLRVDSPDAAWRAAAAVVEQIHAVPPIGSSGAGRFRPVEEDLEYAIRCGLPRDASDRIRHQLDAAASASATGSTTTWVHGDLQPDHFLLDGNDVVAVLDWSDHGRNDPLWDYVVLTFDDPSKLALVLAEPPADQRVTRWRVDRLLSDVRWLTEHDMHDAAATALAELNAQ